MKIIALIILIAVQTALSVWILWLIILSVFSLLSKRKSAEEPNNNQHRFAVIVPAHDEEIMIGRTLASIKNVEYDPDLVDVFVVADNCKDKTASIAEAEGAACILREDTERRGKGYAIQTGLQAIQDAGKTFDAFVFFDADTLVAPHFFQRMNHALSNGLEVIQGHYCVADPDRTWFTRLTHLGFILKNYFQFPGLNRLGLSVPLRGSGMCIRKDVLDNFGWQSTSLTEDLDFSITLVEAGIKIHFDILAENQQYMPPTPATARVQRARWSAGEGQALRGRLIRILIKAFFKGNLGMFFQTLYFASPPLSFLLILGVFVFAGSLVGYVLWWPNALWLVLLAGAITMTYVGYFLLGLSITGISIRYVSAILMIPVYSVWRVFIHLLSAMPWNTSRMAWRKTERV